MTDDDLKELARLIDLTLEYPVRFDSDFREPGMGTDWDCRIGDYLIKKRRNAYAPDPNPQAA